LRHDGFDASDLLDGLCFDARGCVVAASRFSRLHRVEGRVIVYALFELLQHFNGSADPCGRNGRADSPTNVTVTG
jgi:hypothetical protein